MISRLSIGLFLWVVAATLAQRRPPNYSQDRMPVTSFSCRDKIIGGYYADPETDCQMFHVCVKVPGQGVQDYKFLCPNDTSFDQENQICDDWFNIDCEASTLYYSDNFDLYRIGSDFESSNQSPRLPSNNINNAVSEIDDDFYLQKSDRGENVGSDLLRGSHSSNFYSNKNRGREEDETLKEDYKKKNNKNNNVRKLLTGKRPIATTQTPVVENTPVNQYQPRTQNFNSARVSQFRGHARNQQQPTQQTSSETPASSSRQTETYNRGQPFQRNYYSPTTPKIETTTATQRTEYFRNYNPTTKQNYYENTQNYNAQTTGFAQTTRNYYSPRVTTTTTVQPSPAFAETTPQNSERNNYYETQKLFKLNTGGAFNQYDDSKDEFLKTAPSQNLGASAFNSLQNSYKSFNTSVSANYNFNPTQKPTTLNQQTQTYFNPSTQASNYYTPTTLKSFQQNNYYTPNAGTTQQPYQQNYYTPSAQVSTTVKQVPQYTPTTIRPFQQSFAQTQTTFSQYNPTTVKPFQQQYNQPTSKPIQQQYNPSTNKPNQQQYNPPTNKPTQQQYSQPTNKPFQQQYNQPTSKSFQQQYNNPQNYQTATAVQPQQTTNFQSQRNTAAPQSYQPQKTNQQFQNQRNPSQFQQTTNYYNPTTQRTYQQPIQTTVNAKVKIADATEQPRPFTQEIKKTEKKEKEQYDYAYYDDGTQSEYDSFEPLEEFKRTKSKN